LSFLAALAGAAWVSLPFLASGLALAPPSFMNFSTSSATIRPSGPLP